MSSSKSPSKKKRVGFSSVTRYSDKNKSSRSSMHDPIEEYSEQVERNKYETSSMVPKAIVSKEIKKFIDRLPDRIDQGTFFNTVLNQFGSLFTPKTPVELATDTGSDFDVDQPPLIEIISEKSTPPRLTAKEKDDLKKAKSQERKDAAIAAEQQRLADLTAIQAEKINQSKSQKRKGKGGAKYKRKTNKFRHKF